MATRVPITCAAMAAALALGSAPACADAQSIGGRVVLAGWHERVPAARVHLLAADLTTLAQVETDGDGRFAFPSLEPGSYHLKAEYGSTRSSLEGPLTVTADEAALDVEVTLPSELYNQARACPRPSGAPVAGLPLAAGVLAGIAYDAASGTPLPRAKVAVDWIGPGGGENHLETGTDGAGRFVFCGVAAAVPLTVQAQVIGRVVARVDGVRVNDGALARLDLPVELSTAPQLRVLGSSEERPGALATLHGRLLDSSTGAPIAGASVSLQGTPLGTITGDDGSFRLMGVSPGVHTFSVARLGYDWSSGSIEVLAGATMVLELRAAPKAVALEALVVRTTTPESRMARGSTQAPRVIAGVRLRYAEERAASLLDILRDLPNLKIRQGRFETPEGIENGTCVESSRALQRYAIPEKQTTLPWCEMIAIVVDGVATIRGTEMLNLMRVREIESIEFLPPLGALQYGERAAVNGALIIWTRGQGPHADPERSGG